MGNGNFRAVRAGAFVGGFGRVENLFQTGIEDDVSKVGTKREIVMQMNLSGYQEILARVGLARKNEGSYFLKIAEVTPQIRGNANLAKAANFYYSARNAVSENLRNGFRDEVSEDDDRYLWRFIYGCNGSDELCDAVRLGKKESDPSYNALARIIADCRLLAQGAALQIKYGPDVGAVESESLGVNSYENTYFLDALIRTARIQALNSIGECRERNIPCPAALSAFVEADTSRGDFARDQLFDMLANYWTAGNIAQALTLCFDPQPTTEEAAARGNAAAQFLLGRRATLRNDIDAAREFLSKSAAQGDARAQYYLSHLLDDGNVVRDLLEKSAAQNFIPAQEELASVYWFGDEDAGVEQDRKKAFKLFEKAAEAGSVTAQEVLANIYINEDEIVEVDAARGHAWRRIAAERGDAFAQFWLAYDFSRGTPWSGKNAESAARWFSRAAEQGNASAQSRRGECYSYGNGVERDLEKAFGWYLRSAKQGDEVGQFNVGICFLFGHGVRRNYAQAVRWLREAAEAGNKVAKMFLSTLQMPRVHVPDTDFFIGAHEVRQLEYWMLMDVGNSSANKGDDLPVENVSWDDAMEFCRRLTA